MKTIELEQVSASLCEDGRTINVDGLDAEGRIWAQTFSLPRAIDEANFLDDEWIALACSRPTMWFEVYQG